MQSISNIRAASLQNNRFKIEGEKIGSGSYGVVYPAYDNLTKLNCVIKFGQK